MISCILLSGLWFSTVVRASAQQLPAVVIASPRDGDVLRGTVPLVGRVSGDRFLSADISLAYENEETNAWFLINDITQPIEAGQLGLLDTNTITDGAYLIRLRLRRQDGTLEQTLIHVQIRNYTAPVLTAPTPTPTSPPRLQISTPVYIQPSLVPGRPLASTPTTLPANSAALEATSISRSLVYGALTALAAFVVLGAMALRRRS
jgi:hypothetical protein